MSLLSKTHQAWRPVLSSVFSGQFAKDLSQSLESEFRNYRCYPARDDIMNAFNYCGPKDIRVVIVGQDPYHGAGQAHGLAFSVPDGVPAPPSLLNILKEVQSDLQLAQPLANGNLSKWAERGVLLLNSALTVRAGEPASHSSLGWQQATDAIIQKIGSLNPKVVYMLWGNFARTKRGLIGRNLGILEASHPSPLSAHNGFFGCRHFSKANKLLVDAGLEPVDWRLA